MIDRTTVIEVTNRNAGSTSYVIPDNNIHRDFGVGETKRITLEELEQLSYTPGGAYLLKNCLIIKNKDALSYLNMVVEPEYFYTEAEIKKILGPEGSLDQLDDMLNFAPAGVVELAKKIAVETELADANKRKLITKLTGFNIDNAITVNTIMNAENDSEEESQEVTKKRKAAPVFAEPAVKTRKSEPVLNDGEYKVVSYK